MWCSVFQTSIPGEVHMFLANDYAYTSCASIDLRATKNGIKETRRFLNANSTVDHMAMHAAFQSASSVITSFF